MTDLQAARQEARDVLVRAGVPDNARVRLPRRGAPHPGVLRMTDVEARIRWDAVRRNAWLTVHPRHLDHLEIKVGARFVPFAEFEADVEEDAMRSAAFERWKREGAGMASLDLRAAAQHAQAIGDAAAERGIDAVLESREARGVA